MNETISHHPEETNNLIRDYLKFRAVKISPTPPEDSADRIFKLTTIAFALCLKDHYTEAHARRTASYSGRLAVRMGLYSGEVENIWLGGLLHDIGKIGLSKRIFNHTNAELPEDMIAEVRRHPTIGMSILKDFKFPPSVLEYVYYHHERIDGTGYPCGLTGEEIPLGAKIISVADCFDAMTTDRPYQRGKRNAEALAILKQMSGKGLCSKLVDAFTEDILERGMIKLSERADQAYALTSTLWA